MTEISHFVRLRRRLAGAGTAAALVALTVTLTPGAPALAASGPPVDAAQPATRAATPTEVMTRNLYLGADLTGIIAALASQDNSKILAAATQTWSEVQASDPADRMAAVADEIAAARPAAVGLQEVTTWSSYPYDPLTGQTGAPKVEYDFLDLLLKALADRGVVYHEVSGATSHNFTSPAIPVLTGAPFPTRAVSLADRDVILRRDDVKVVPGSEHHGNFQTILAPPDAPLAVQRGWGSADLQAGFATFRFVNAHTEAWGPDALRVAQVGELLAAQAEIATQQGALPTVYVGDYNSVAPTSDAYKALTQQLQDVWLKTNRNAPGYSCCQAPLLDNTTSQLDQRIDLVLATKDVTAARSYLTGTSPVRIDQDTWWASDHAGVVARLLIH